MSAVINIPFHKMQGAGNDFIVIDHDPQIDYPHFARKACDRNMGIGADGVLVLDQSTVCDYRMRIINADGSEAEMCGNGARCMAVYIAEKFSPVAAFSMETLAGKINAMVSGETASVQLSDPKDYRANSVISVAAQAYDVHFINTGVPHAVIFVPDLKDVDVNGLGRLIRNHMAFSPKGTNVNFVERINSGCVSLRTYERGVEAETLACGTGSVAAALIGYLNGGGILHSSKNAAMRVVTRSGEMLDISFDLEMTQPSPLITNVTLKGSGKFICKGEYYYQP
ncbi:MAG: diaminopimelate epimerase [Candidatus Omnitrophota bacterium]